MNTRFFEIAKLAAYKSTHPRIWIGAVLVKNGKPRAIGFNKYGKTNPLAPWFTHAELDTFMGLNHRPIRTELYLFRINRLSSIGNCKPCKDCQKFLYEQGVRKVYYTIGNSGVFGPIYTIGELKL